MWAQLICQRFIVPVKNKALGGADVHKAYHNVNLTAKIMSVNNFKPQIWSREVLFSLKKQLMGLNIVNRNYQGEITNEGDTVRITTPAAINVGNYTGANITVQALTSTQQSLVIDQAKFFAFDVDDVDQAQANVNLMQTYMEEAAFALANTADQFILSSYAEALEANVIDDGGFTSSNAYTQLTKAAKLLNKQNVPSVGRYAVVDPEGIEALSNSTAFQRASDLGDTTSREGFMGRAAGFDIWMSNNVITDDSDVKHYLFGHPIAITFADQILKTEADRRELRFGDIVKGLHVYGKKVVRPAALGTIEVDLNS